MSFLVLADLNSESEVTYPLAISVVLFTFSAFFTALATFTPFCANLAAVAASPIIGNAARTERPVAPQSPLNAYILAFNKSGIAPTPGAKPAASNAN